MKDASPNQNGVENTSMTAEKVLDQGQAVDLRTRLAHTEKALEALIECSPCGMYLWQDGQFVLSNLHLSNALGLSTEGLIELWPNGYPGHASETFQPSCGNEYDSAPPYWRGRIQHQTHGQTIDLDVSVVRCEYRGKPAILGQVLGTPASGHLGEILTEHQQRHNSLIQFHPDIVFSLTPEGTVDSINPAITRVTGYSSEDIVGADFLTLIRAELRDKVAAHFERTLQGYTESYEVGVAHKFGQVVDLHITNIPVIVDGKICGIYGIAKDVTPHRTNEAAMNQLAFFDPLTSLPNLTLFRSHLEKARDSAELRGKKLAVLTLDLDRFKVINDTLGMAIGDKLLVAVADRLARSIRDHDTVGRTGNDEFSLLLLDVPSLDDVLLLADRIRSVIEQSITVDEYELHVMPSIGITMFPDDGTDAATLLSNADTALNNAKSKGNGYIQAYREEMTHSAREKLRLENDLRKALEREEFEVYYQPRVDLFAGTVIGVEALLRWRHPTLGMVSPAVFIPLAEESGLIVPIGEWVLRTACSQAKAWIDSGLPPIVMAVNLSARQFHQSELLTTVSDALATTGLDPNLLELEITESIIMHNEEATTTTLTRLRAAGVKISIDDFGTGYSSLTYLKRFPIDSIKIDQSFVCDIAQSHGDQAIAVAVITLAHSLSLKVVAEGVETIEQLKFLKSKSCDEMQGYLYSRPVPASDCTELLHGRVAPSVELTAHN